MSWLRRWSEEPVREDELAVSAFDTLGELAGEMQAARVMGIVALKRPDIFQTASPAFVVRICIGTIVLALRRFDDMWTAQISPVLLKASSAADGSELRREIQQRRLRAVGDQLIAHYGARKLDPKAPMTKLEELLVDGRFASNEEFFLWTRDAIARVEKVRTRIAEKYRLARPEPTGAEAGAEKD